jgi:hypothetical protein
MTTATMPLNGNVGVAASMSAARGGDDAVWVNGCSGRAYPSRNVATDLGLDLY